MILSNSLKKRIEELYNNTPEDIHSVSFGFKYINNVKTNIFSIIFYVDKKIPQNQLSTDLVLPSSIIIDDIKYLTDVQEQPRAVLCTCYNYVGDLQDLPQDIRRLRIFEQSNPSPIIPMRGGMEIAQYPTKIFAETIGDEIFIAPTLGTLGLFCIDNSDGTIIGLTNAHVAVYNSIVANDSQRNWIREQINPYNTYEPFNDDEANSLNITASPRVSTVTGLGNNQSSLLNVGTIKRYQPISTSNNNFIDVTIVQPDQTLLDANSYRIFEPIGSIEYSNFLPFASTNEIDNLLISNPRLYSTGRTTGPKGFGALSSCTLRIKDLGLSATIQGDGYSLPGSNLSTTFTDTIEYEYEDESLGPAQPGDSGSILLADINGTRKVIGLVFAIMGDRIALACRIDRIAENMNIRAWDNTVNFSAIPSVKNAAGILLNRLDSRAGNTSIVFNNKRYYQVGFTRNTNYLTLPLQ